MKLLWCSDFHRCFLNVDFFIGSHSVYFHKTLEIFDLSSLFSRCGIFQRSTFSKFRWSTWEVWSFINIFKVWNFPEVHILNIFDEPLEKFGISSIFSKFGICQRFTLSTFSIKFLRIFYLHRYFPRVGFFQRFTLSTFTMKLLGSLDFQRDFLSVEFFRALCSELSDETLEKLDFSSIFHKFGIFQRFTVSKFWWNSREVWSFINIFWVWNFPEFHT